MHKAEHPRCYVGDVVETTETDDGLAIKGRFDLDTEFGKSAYRNTKGRRVSGLSIGHAIRNSTKTRRLPRRRHDHGLGLVVEPPADILTEVLDDVICTFCATLVGCSLTQFSTDLIAALLSTRSFIGAVGQLLIRPAAHSGVEGLQQMVTSNHRSTFYTQVGCRRDKNGGAAARGVNGA